MYNYPEVVAKIVNDYLERVKSQLRLVPAHDQGEFLREIESHLYEAYQQTPGDDDVTRILTVLRNFGEPAEVVSDRLPGAMVRSGAMPDASHLWWAVRVSKKYPTLELRAPDCCTRLEDAVAIATLYRTLARYLYNHPEHNADIDVVDRSIAVENKWRAQRYGARGRFVTRSGSVSVAAVLDRLLEFIAGEADDLGCSEELEHCRLIALEGTSAEAQLRIFTENEHEGAEIALHKVAEWIRDATSLA